MDSFLPEIRALCRLIDPSAPEHGTRDELQAWCSELIRYHYTALLGEHVTELAAEAWNHIEQSARISHIGENAARAQDPWPESVEAVLTVGSHCRAEASSESDLNWMVIVSEEQRLDGPADVCDQLRMREGRLFNAYDLDQFVESYCDELPTSTRIKCFTSTEITAELSAANRASIGVAVLTTSMASPSPDSSGRTMSELRLGILHTVPRVDLGIAQLCALLFKLYELEDVIGSEYRASAMTRHAAHRTFSALGQSLHLLFAHQSQMTNSGSLDGSGRIYPYWFLAHELDRLHLSDSTKQTFARVALQLSQMRAGRDDVAEGLAETVSFLTRSILVELGTKDLGVSGGKINMWLSTLAGSPHQDAACAGVCP
jgi:hypothetical protein